MEDNSNEALKNIAPILSGIKRKQNFSVPPNYFDTLPDIVLEKAQNQPISIQKQPNTWQKIGYIIAIAASMSGVFFGWKQFQPVVSPAQPLEIVAKTPIHNENIAIFSDAAIYEYIHKNLNEVEDAALEHLLTEDDMEIAYFFDDTDITLDVNDDSL
jgi:hypothetical protein